MDNIGQMSRFQNARTFFNIACYLLFACMVNARPLVGAGLLKLVVFLVLTTLLTFVVVHSPAIARAVLSFISALRVVARAFPTERKGAVESQAAALVPTHAVVSPLFQRPPPALLF